MKNIFRIKIIALLFALSACHDTRSFENVRHLKKGMALSEVERLMGKVVGYTRLSDTSEKRWYIFDNPGNGIDRHLIVTFENDRLVNVKHSW
jgi:hypothetical protein